MIYGMKHFSHLALNKCAMTYILCVSALLAMSARTVGARQRVEIVPLPFDSIPMQINNRGQIAGAVLGKGSIKLFVYTNHSSKIVPIHIWPGLEGLVLTGVSINGKGVVAASIVVKPPLDVCAFTWHHGKISLLKSVGSKDDISYAQGINNRDEVVGLLRSGKPFIWSSGKASYFADNSNMLAVNDQGEIVGDIAISGSDRHHSHPALYSHPAIWIHERAKDLGLPQGSTDATAFALNNHGLVVGYGIFPTSANKTKQSGIRRRYLPCVWGPHGAKQLPSFEGSSYGIATAVNNLGEIVGGSGLAGKNIGRAILWEGPKMLDLNNLLSPGSHWVLSMAYSINDRRDIVGTGLYRGNARGFLMHRTR